jgi:fimbrial isopeptide formation D2 family protein
MHVGGYFSNDGYFLGQAFVWGYEPRPGVRDVAITDANYNVVNHLYGRPQYNAESRSTKIWAYVGYSAKFGWFAIQQYCGNLITDTYPTPPTPPPAPANIVTSKTAVNATQNIDASKNAAQANDKITYTITAKNTGGTAKTVDFSDNLREVLAYSKLINNGGGTFNTSTMALSWPSVNMAPGATVTHSYTVQMNSSLISVTTECSMKNAFTTHVVTVPVGCVTPPAKIETHKAALNVSQGNVDATTTTAKENDRLTFTITVKNTGGTAKKFIFEDNIGDTLEYAKLVDNGGGTYSEQTRTLSWPEIDLKPGETQVRTFTVQVLSTIPATPKGLSDPTSYNCRIENVFYTSSVIIPVTCPTPKVIEQVVPELPKTGPTENMLFAGIVLAVVTFFYFRARQLSTEVRLIRRDVNGGTI